MGAWKDYLGAHGCDYGRPTMPPAGEREESRVTEPRTIFYVVMAKQYNINMFF